MLFDFADLVSMLSSILAGTLWLFQHPCRLAPGGTEMLNRQGARIPGMGIYLNSHGKTARNGGPHRPVSVILGSPLPPVLSRHLEVVPDKLLSLKCSYLTVGFP